MNTQLSRELRAAREAFDRLGRIPYDVACKLMKLGVIVPQLEDNWSRLPAHG